MHITRGTQYSEEFPRIINIKQLHFKTAVRIASACTRKGPSQLTRLLCTHCQRNENIHMHILLRPASGHLFENVKVGEHAVSYSDCIELVHQIERLTTPPQA